MQTVFSIDFWGVFVLLPYLYNSFNESRDTTEQSACANKHHYQWAQFIFSSPLSTTGWDLYLKSPLRCMPRLNVIVQILVYEREIVNESISYHLSHSVFALVSSNP